MYVFSYMNMMKYVSQTLVPCCCHKNNFPALIFRDRQKDRTVTYHCVNRIY
jgi:hypothetical protein